MPDKTSLPTIISSVARTRDGDSGKPLALFAQYLHEAGLSRFPEALYHEADAWRPITFGLVKGFVKWQLQHCYAIGSVNVRLATIRTYCRLAFESGVIDSEALALIKTVDGYSRHPSGAPLTPTARSKACRHAKDTRKSHRHR
jgi:hypothetical protein